MILQIKMFLNRPIVKKKYNIFIVFQLLALLFYNICFSQDNIKTYINSYEHKIDGAIEMQLAKGWHTYWKYPGVNGSPPALKIISQTNLASLNFTWPFPKILGPSNYKYLGYDRSLLIPFEIIKLNHNINAQASIEFSYGICKTICVVKKAVLNIQEGKSSNIEELEKIYLAFSQKPSILEGAPDSMCSLKSTGTNTFELNIKNKVLYENKNIGLVLVDNNNKKYSFDYQYFNPQTGVIKADVYSEEKALTEFELEKVNILLLINDSPKIIIGCKS